MYQELESLIDLCKKESDIGNQVQILRDINLRLPRHLRLSLPSLFTTDYIRKALDVIEEKVRR